MIPESILQNCEASLITAQPGDLIIEEDTPARYYFQIKKGSIKMFNMNEDGKEFLQGIFYDGESFGEPPLFADFLYPASATALKVSAIYKLPKEKLFQLLRNHPEINLNFAKALAKRLFYKATILKEISGYTPEHRILTLIDFRKKKYGDKNELFKVELTRQQIADLTGLRVETVIRAIKQLELKGEIQIIKRKVYR